MTNYFRISLSSQTGNTEEHLLAAESWRGSAKSKGNYVNWWRALFMRNKTPVGHPYVGPHFREGSRRVPKGFGTRKPHLEYDGETASSWGWFRAGAKWKSFEWHLATPSSEPTWSQAAFCAQSTRLLTVSSSVLQGQHLAVLHVRSLSRDFSKRPSAVSIPALNTPSLSL